MRLSMKWMAPLMGLAMLLALPQTPIRADTPATGKASVTVTVLDKSGKPVAHARVMLFARQKHQKSGAGAGGKDPSQKRPRPTPIAQGTTDENGKISFPDIADGRYGAMAGIKGEGRGHTPVSVTGSSDVSVTITLEPRPAGSRQAPTDPK